MTEINLKTKIATFNVDGETKINFQNYYNSFAIRASAEVGITNMPNKHIGDDGVLRCLENQSTVYSTYYTKEIYIIGTAKIEIYAGNNIDINPFKSNSNSSGGGGSAVLGTKYINQNGVYLAKDDSFDGYSKVTIDVNCEYKLDYAEGGKNINFISESLSGVTYNLYNFPVNLKSEHESTFELFMNVNSARNYDGRYLDIPSNIKIADRYDNGKFYLELCLNGYDWDIYYNRGDRIELPSDVDYTLTLRVKEDGTDIFINGEFYTFNENAKAANIYPIRVAGQIYLFDLASSSRDVSGTFYSLRIYNRALTDAEIAYNYIVDLKAKSLFS